MTSYVQIPNRIVIGSNLAIVTLASTAGFLGKAMSRQIEWLFTLPILVATIPATFIGSLTSKRVSFIYLQLILAVLIAIAAVRTWFSILWP
jgi:uncharacterized membrane protein YfcA